MWWFVFMIDMSKRIRQLRLLVCLGLRALRAALAVQVVVVVLFPGNWVVKVVGGSGIRV